MNGAKRCTKCNRLKMLDEFSVERRAVDGRRSYCKPCGVQFTKAYNAKNAAVVSEKRKAMYAKNKEKYAEYFRRYYRERAEQIKQRSREWTRENKIRKQLADAAYRKEHKDKIAATRQAWLAANLDRYREMRNSYARKAYSKNPERDIAKVKARRALRLGAPINDFTSEQWEIVKQLYRMRCAYCHKKKKLTQDHIIPLSKGGSHTLSNIAPACITCNSRKRDREAPTYQTVMAL
jgi:5-methylcytosine-specific restriction endonuclease McrA